MVRLVSAASRLLRYANQGERIEVENATVLALAKKRQLVSNCQRKPYQGAGPRAGLFALGIGAKGRAEQRT
jgi:hypothetical protein